MFYRIFLCCLLFMLLATMTFGAPCESQKNSTFTRRSCWNETFRKPTNSPTLTIIRPKVSLRARQAEGQQCIGLVLMIMRMIMMIISLMIMLMIIDYNGDDVVAWPIEVASIINRKGLARAGLYIKSTFPPLIP